MHRACLRARIADTTSRVYSEPFKSVMTVAIDPEHLRMLMAKIDALPPERVAEVEDFVEFIRLRDQDQQARTPVTRASQPSFANVWNNADDAAYDAL